MIVGFFISIPILVYLLWDCINDYKKRDLGAKNDRQIPIEEPGGFTCIARYDYTANHKQQLSFNKRDLIINCKEHKGNHQFCSHF